MAGTGARLGDVDKRYGVFGQQCGGLEETPCGGLSVCHRNRRLASRSVTLARQRRLGIGNARERVGVNVLARVMLRVPGMTGLARWALALAVFCGLVLGPRLAEAQSIAPPLGVQYYYPDRYVNGAEVGTSRPAGLNPNGINYADCVSDLTLVFNLTLSGFTGTQSLEIWATAGSDCTDPATRGVTGLPPTCWQLAGGSVSPASGAQPFKVRAQDLVGPQGAPPDPPVVVSEGPAACFAQPSFAAVPITIWFLPVDSSGSVSSGGIPYMQQFTTDLVGPPAPLDVGETVGDTIFNVTWTANSDGDTAGYDIFMDPPQGTQASDSSTSGIPSAQEQVLYCPPSDAGDAGSGDASSASETSSTDGSDASEASNASEASTDDANDVGDATDFSDGSGASDATVTSSSSGVDAGCYYVYAGPSSSTGSLSNAGACKSTALSSGFELDGGAAVATESGVSSGAGGLSLISCADVQGVGSNCYTGGGETVTGESATGYTITGLTDQTTYDVVVAAVDGSGNVGPPSSCVHDFPAPITDFYSTYAGAGGTAGGGFCALDAVGLPTGSAGLVGGVVAGLLAAIRRRRRAAAPPPRVTG